LLAEAFGAALSQECRCLLIADQTPPRSFVKALGERGCDIASALETGQFVLLTADETYLQGGLFEPDRQLALWDDAIGAARKDGFAGLCASGEVTWFPRGVRGADRWLEYEYRLNFIEDRDFAGIICLYGARGGLPDSVETELIRSHPLLHVEGEMEVSKAYVGDGKRVADVPLAEELEPPADQLPCALLAELLSADADDELQPRRRDEIARHLANCPRCARAAARHADLKKALSGLRVGSDAPEGFWDRARRQLGK
jgi:hypothetical protein